MRILITGVAGMIGSRLAHWLIENTEHTVFGIDNLSSGDRENLPPITDTFYFYEADILESDKVNFIFNEVNPHIVYHFAAYAAEGRSNYIRQFNHTNNTVGAAIIINACVNHDAKLIFTSSVAVYSGTPPFNEEMTPNPIDSYGVSKYCSEMDIRIAGETQGLDWCIIRPRNVYGIGQSLFDPARNLFGIFMYNALNNKPLVIFGDGNNKRSFTYIDDILEPLYNAIKISNQIINIGSDKVYTINQAAEIFGEVSGYTNIVHSEARHEVSFAYCDSEKSKQMLGFKDETSIYKGVKLMWEWAKTKKMKPLQIPPKLEVTKNLHSSIK